MLRKGVRRMSIIFFSSYLLVFIKGGNYWAGNEILQLSLIN